MNIIDGRCIFKKLEVEPLSCFLKRILGDVTAMGRHPQGQHGGCRQAF